MPATVTAAPKLLILSTGAGSMTPEIENKLREEFQDYLIVEFDPKLDFEKLIAPKAKVVVAGGDGTIGFVVRKLADSDHPVGIIAIGTYNNFARSLGLPTNVQRAISVVKDGRPHPITLGRVNGVVFLEAAAIGLFGDTIAVGEAAKDRAFGELAKALPAVMAAKPFAYELKGDLEGSGHAMSLVFTNTPSIGARMPVGDTSPIDPYLELSIQAGRSRTDILGRVIGSGILGEQRLEPRDQVFRFRRLEVTTKPKTRVYADNHRAGHTPATVTAEVSSLKVILPS